MSIFSKNNSSFKNIHIYPENINNCSSRLLTAYWAQIPPREILILLDNVINLLAPEFYI
jgi:type II secretory pathway component PulM